MTEEEPKLINPEETRLPFNPTIVTQQGDLLSDFKYSEYPLLFFTTITWFYIFIFMASSIFLYASTPYTNAFQDAFYFISGYSIVAAAFFYFIRMNENLVTSEKLMKTFYPQRTMTFFDLFPDTEGLSINQDIFYRLLYIFFKIKPASEDEKKQIKENVKSRINHEVEIKKGKKRINFELYYEITSSFKVITKGIWYFIGTLILFISIGTACGYGAYTTDLIMSAIFYFSIMIMNLMIIIIYLYGVFNTKELVILRYIKEKLTVDQVKSFSEDVIATISGNRKILFVGLLTNSDIDKTSLDYIQSDDGKIFKEHVITLIQKTKNGYKLIWTG